MIDQMRGLLGLPPTLETQKTGGKKRSPKWERVRTDFLDHNPFCAACGFHERAKLNVHHVRPFSDYPELELFPDNLLTLCEGPMQCHLRIGHCGNFQRWNPTVRGDAFHFKRMLDNRKDKRLIEDGPTPIKEPVHA